MVDPSRLLFIYGSDSNSQTYKATILRSLFPGMVTPVCYIDLSEHVAQLRAILGNETG